MQKEMQYMDCDVEQDSTTSFIRASSSTAQEQKCEKDCRKHFHHRANSRMTNRSNNIGKLTTTFFGSIMALVAFTFLSYQFELAEFPLFASTSPSSTPNQANTEENSNEETTISLQQHKDHTIMNQTEEKPQNDKKIKKNTSLSSEFRLDVYVIGFAKTGTSTLLKVFDKTNVEIAMLPHENHALLKADITPQEAWTKLETRFHEELPNMDLSSMKTAMKTPTVIRNITAIQRLVELTQHNTNQNTKLILGVRHPMKLFQSLFNYRVKAIHNANDSDEIASIPEHLDSLIGDETHSWKKLYTDNARFELFMKQLAKVDVSAKELKEMKQHGLQLAPNPYEVFLYNVEQLGDENVERAEQFRSDLQRFLELKNPIAALTPHNVNKKSFPEYLNICDKKHEHLRQVMVSQGEVTARWIRDLFLQSEDVLVGGKEHFLDLLHSWGTDYCTS